VNRQPIAGFWPTFQICSWAQVRLPKPATDSCPFENLFAPRKVDLEFAALQRGRCAFSSLHPNATTHGPPTSSAVLVNLGNGPLITRCFLLRVCLKILRGAAAGDFGRGQGGEVRASPQRAVRTEPTQSTGKRPAARRVFVQKALTKSAARLHPPLSSGESWIGVLQNRNYQTNPFSLFNLNRPQPLASI